MASAENMMEPLALKEARGAKTSEMPPTEDEVNNRVEGKKSHVDSSAEYLANCIQSWKQVFPWMHYEGREQLFTCVFCEWGSVDPELTNIFCISKPSDVHQVAKKLRKHKENPKHQKIFKKHEDLSDLCKQIYSLLKMHPQDTLSLDDIVSAITNSSGGVFPGPVEKQGKCAFVGFMIRCIAECIEENLLNSLSKSPYFSIFTLEGREYSVVRWLNAKGQSEEHIFCSYIRAPGEPISCISYLERRNVDMNKLVSCTVLSKDGGNRPNMKLSPVIEVSVHIPQFDLFLCWVEKNTFLKELFEYLKVLSRCCKAHFSVFSEFSGALDLYNIEEPFGFKCIVKENILTMFFNQMNLFKAIAANIHKETSNMDASVLSSLKISDPEKMFRCALLIPKLHAIMEPVCRGVLGDSVTELETFNSYISKRIQEFQGDNDEYMLLLLINIFVSHVLLTVRSGNWNVVFILTKTFDSLSQNDIDLLLSNFLYESKYVRDYNLLENLKSSLTHLPQPSPCNLLQILEVLDVFPNLQRRYADLDLLRKKVKVLPCFRADRQQSIFNIGASQLFMSECIPKHLQPPLTLISLEGPPYQQINVEQVLDIWVKKWKSWPPHTGPQIENYEI